MKALRRSAWQKTNTLLLSAPAYVADLDHRVPELSVSLSLDMEFLQVERTCEDRDFSMCKQPFCLQKIRASTNNPNSKTILGGRELTKRTSYPDNFKNWRNWSWKPALKYWSIEVFCPHALARLCANLVENVERGILWTVHSLTPPIFLIFGIVLHPWSTPSPW